VLGPTVSPVIQKLPDVACTVAAVAADDESYTTAISLVISGDRFAGDPRDDFRVPANRERIFGGHLRTLERAKRTVDGLDPATDVERRLVEAAREDVDTATTLAANDRRFAPGDPAAPIPEVFPTRLDDAVEQTSQDIRTAFRKCTIPPDVLRRQKAYGGG
jgi:hypothetical protein